MSKIKLTKGELKRQRDSLQQFSHYLPILILKKQQLQIKIQLVRKELEEKAEELNAKKKSLEKWVGLLADPGVKIKDLILPEKVSRSMLNIAGANVPVLKDVEFKESEYDYYSAPFWVDRGIEELREFFALFIEISIINQQIGILQGELRITTQRVNLFEKVKIPECMDNIRKIRIYLGDQQANAVGISKVAKKKIEMMVGVD